MKRTIIVIIALIIFQIVSNVSVFATAMLLLFYYMITPKKFFDALCDDADRLMNYFFGK